MGIHVAHFVIDGGVRNAEKGRVEGGVCSNEAGCEGGKAPAQQARGSAERQGLGV
jgi:hypothetical protein